MKSSRRNIFALCLCTQLVHLIKGQSPVEEIVPQKVPEAPSLTSTEEHEPQFETAPSTSYGYDISFPMLGKVPVVSSNYPWLPHNTDPGNNPTPEMYQGMPIQPLGDRQSFYHEYIQGCKDYWKEDGKDHLCDEYELQRLEHNTDQIPSMVNFTDVGYKKIRAPEHIFALLLEFWEKNKHREVDEDWFPGNIFVNYWKSPSKMVNVEDKNNEGGGDELLDELWEASVDTISEWTGQKLVPSSLYGIRVYKEGAVLSCHVDRLPLVSSAIINVAQDPDAEPWPLEVIGHDGIARNVTMEPGDMVLYESHSVMHGRPFPLKGKYYANVFIHFEPDPEYADDPDSDLPPYILEGSAEAKKFRAGEYDGTIPSSNAQRLKEKFDDKRHASHDAAGDGDLDFLIEIAKEDATALHLEDMNGWQPLHEAARSGHMEVVEFLTDQGADVNARTRAGHSVLQIVADFWGQDDPMYEYLSNLGALEMGPEL